MINIPFVDFRSLVQALFNVEKGISKSLWLDSTFSSSDTKGKKVVETLEGLTPLVLRENSLLSRDPRQWDLSFLIHITNTNSLSFIIHLFISLWLLKLVWDHSWHISKSYCSPAIEPYVQRSKRQYTPLGMTLTQASKSFEMLGFWLY